jgi:Fe2+ transport system protein FeoA
MKLDEMKEGTTCILSNFDTTNLSSQFIYDLMDVGLLPETKMEILKIYKYMNKILLKIGDGELGLRITDAKFIEVRIESS